MGNSGNHFNHNADRTGDGGVRVEPTKGIMGILGETVRERIEIKLCKTVSGRAKRRWKRER